MAKINHNNYLDTIDELIVDAQKRGVVHLFTDGEELTGRELNINGRDLLNFGTCGYLGLEMEESIKEGAIDFTRRYGTQFSVSRTYVTSGFNVELETLLRKMYGHPVIVSPSTSTSHIAVIPTIVRDNAAIILDQQVHMSVQTACQLVKPRGIPVEMIRHSNMEMLERKLIEWQGRYDKIWYMIDGVYSMYGDIAPLDDILRLMAKYDALHVYVDDAHGMSWYGKNGAGYVFDKIGVPKKMVLVTTLAKGFGVTGGITVFPTEEMYEKVRVFGGPLTYSHPLAPPLLGAAIASANIHLSDKIYTYQAELKERIDYCNKLFEVQDLPVISNPDTPIYFIGMGHPRVGYNMVKRLLDDGFYLNIGLFPAVPVKNTGVRFTLTRHQQLKDIKALVNCIAYHFPKALAEEGLDDEKVFKAFKINTAMLLHSSNGHATKVFAPLPVPAPVKDFGYTIQHENSINNIDKNTWDKLLACEGSFTWDALHLLEIAFSGHEKIEDNWDFHYYIIRDNANKPVLATFLTVGVYKDDLLSQAAISMQIEDKRKDEPYYLTSKTIGMGSLLTEGKHLFIDRNKTDWKEIFSLLIDQLLVLQEQTGAENIILRDFEEADEEIRDFLLGEGFVKIAMPHANLIDNLEWNTTEEFLATLSQNSRKNIRREVLKFEDKFTVQIKESITQEEAELYYEMYLNVKSRNFSINYFPYPKKLFAQFQHFPDWEYVFLYLKPENKTTKENLPVAIAASYEGENHYCPMILGMDYDYAYDFKAYKQILYQIVKRAKELGKSKIYMGFSADLEKRKLG
ncbi:MAG: aminotransferase class I/II-fold pyridoxal phosphate-dependent enzyme, partial [Sphingobacteriales bacterium]